MSAVLLDARNVFKSFPGVRALNDVSISVQAGEILAIVGHNGSGKSTFVKVMAGVYQADSGEIICTGGSPRLGHHGGLHFIHQDLGLVATLTTIENLDLGRSLGAKALLPSPVKSERKHARALIKQFGAHFDVELQVSQLTPAERTIVAIARALDGWTTSENVLVLDEPTAALQDEEVGKLFEAIRRVASAGAGVILISHRLDEVVEIADRVVVLRDGCVVADSPRGKFDKAALVQLIAGQASVEGCEATIAPELGEVRLSVRQLRATQIAGLDIDVQGGEIVGITGLLGSGMEHVAGAIFGAVARESGTVQIDGRKVEAASPAASIKAGMGYAPSDRRRFGAIVTMSARENLTLPRLASFRRTLGHIDTKAEIAEANKWMNYVNVRPASSADRMFSLFSGGNQQKIVIAKWLRNKPQVLLLEEPTQGVDVAAQASIYELVAAIAATGAAVLVASTDTKELVTLCNRVIVLHDGEISEVLEGSKLTESALVRATIDRP